jgi:hypothetical protein
MTPRLKPRPSPLSASISAARRVGTLATQLRRLTQTTSDQAIDLEAAVGRIVSAFRYAAKARRRR